MITANYKKVEKEVERLIDQYGIIQPGTDIIKVAELEGATVTFKKMSGQLEQVSGFVDLESGKIYINADDEPVRQVFTIAHELGHYLLHQDQKDKVGVLPRLANVETHNPVEQEANYFAATLLVPKSILKETMIKYRLNKDDYKLLAKLFGVSPTMMQFRLKNV